MQHQLSSNQGSSTGSDTGDIGNQYNDLPDLISLLGGLYYRMLYLVHTTQSMIHCNLCLRVGSEGYKEGIYL